VKCLQQHITTGKTQVHVKGFRNLIFLQNSSTEIVISVYILKVLCVLKDAIS